MLHDAILSWILKQGSSIFRISKKKEQRFNSLWARLCKAKYLPRNQTVTATLLSVIDSEKEHLTSGAYLHLTNELKKSYHQENSALYQIVFKKYGVEEVMDSTRIRVISETHDKCMMLKRKKAGIISSALSLGSSVTPGSVGLSGFDDTNDISVLTGISNRNGRISALKTKLTLEPLIEIIEIVEIGQSYET